MDNKILLVFAVLVLFSGQAFAQTQVLQVTNVSTVPSKIYSDGVVTLTFDVKNGSTNQIAEGADVNISLNENYFRGIKVFESLGRIRPEESKTVSMSFEVLGALPGNYTVPVFLSYKDNADRVSYSRDVTFFVNSCSTLKVEGISLSNPTPHIGDTLLVNAVIVNGCKTSARDVSVELKPVTNTTIAPFVVGGGSIRKLGSVDPDSNTGVVFALNITDKVDAKAYVFSIDANCESCSSKSSNSFSFQVLGKPELVFSNIEYSVENSPDPNADKVVMQGSIVTFSVQLDNIGQEKAKAVRAELNFDEDISGTSKTFIGNINPDDSGAAVFNLSVSPGAKTGEHAGSITVSYLDEQGTQKSFVENYSLFVAQQPQASPVVYIFILILLAVVLGIVYFIIKFVFRQLAIRKQSR